MKLFQSEQRSLFGEILDWMLAPLLLLWPISIAATSSTRTPNAYTPVPGVTTARSAILVSATRMPSSITSGIAQGRIKAAQRARSPTQCGALARREASSAVKTNAM